MSIVWFDCRSFTRFPNYHYKCVKFRFEQSFLVCVFVRLFKFICLLLIKLWFQHIHKKLSSSYKTFKDAKCYFDCAVLCVILIFVKSFLIQIHVQKHIEINLICCPLKISHSKSLIAYSNSTVYKLLQMQINIFIARFKYSFFQIHFSQKRMHNNRMQALRSLCKRYIHFRKN